MKCIHNVSHRPCRVSYLKIQTSHLGTPYYTADEMSLCQQTHCSATWSACGFETSTHTEHRRFTGLNPAPNNFKPSASKMKPTGKSIFLMINRQKACLGDCWKSLQMSVKFFTTILDMCRLAVDRNHSQTPYMCKQPSILHSRNEMAQICVWEKATQYNTDIHSM